MSLKPTNPVETLTAADAQSSDGFGRSTAVDSGTIIVGARLKDGGLGDPLTDMGATFAYRGSWMYMPVVLGP